MTSHTRALGRLMASYCVERRHSGLGSLYSVSLSPLRLSCHVSLKCHYTCIRERSLRHTSGRENLSVIANIEFVIVAAVSTFGRYKHKSLQEDSTHAMKLKSLFYKAMPLRRAQSTTFLSCSSVTKMRIVVGCRRDHAGSHPLNMNAGPSVFNEWRITFNVDWCGMITSVRAE